MTAHRSGSSSNGSSSRRIWEVGTRDVVVVDEFLENGDGLVRIGGGQGLSIVELLLSKHHLSEVRFQCRSSGGDSNAGDDDNPSSSSRGLHKKKIERILGEKKEGEERKEGKEALENVIVT